MLLDELDVRGVAYAWGLDFGSAGWDLRGLRVRGLVEPGFGTLEGSVPMPAPKPKPGPSRT